MDESPKILSRIKYSSYLIVVSFTIIRWILTYIDKHTFDFIITFDLLISIFLLISLTISIMFIRRDEGILGSTGCIIFFFVINFVFIVANAVAPFFSYHNSRCRDFQGICIFMIILRIIIAILCNICYFIIEINEDL